MTTTSGFRCWPRRRVDSGSTPTPQNQNKKLLPSVSEFAGGVALLQRFGLAVFDDELVDDVGEALRAELETFDGDELLRGCAGKFEGEAGAGLVANLEFHFAGREIRPREALQEFGV